MALKTNYKDDILDLTQNDKRCFEEIQNQDGSTSFRDVTVYEQEGDNFGAQDINATNEAVNQLDDNLTASDNLKFQFTKSGNDYGYRNANGVFVPFKKVQASKTVTAGTSAKTVSPDSGYNGIASVTVNPTPSQSKSITATTSAQTVSPDSGKLLSSVTVNPQVHSGTRASVTSNGTIDLGATHNIRYVPVSVSGSGLVPINVYVSHSINSTANSITLRYLDVASKSFKTTSTTVYGSTSQYGKGSWSVSLGGISCSISISEISVGDGSMVRCSASTGAATIAKALSGYADYNVPNSSYAYAMSVTLA